MSATVWPLRYVGLRANAARARTPGREGNTFSSVAFENPVVWLYSMDVALRYPLGERIAFTPYIAGGYGGKTYLWSLGRRSAGTRYNTSWGWTVAGGLEVRPASSSIGLRVEIMRQRSQFAFFEYAGPSAEHEFYGDEDIVHPGVVKGDLDFPNLNDLMLSVALTLNR